MILPNGLYTLKSGPGTDSSPVPPLALKSEGVITHGCDISQTIIVTIFSIYHSRDVSPRIYK